MLFEKRMHIDIFTCIHTYVDVLDEVSGVVQRRNFGMRTGHMPCTEGLKPRTASGGEFRRGESIEGLNKALRGVAWGYIPGI